MSHRKRIKPSRALLLVCTGICLSFLIGLSNGCNNTPSPRRGNAARVLLGAKETCLNCHSDYTGFAPSHDPAKIGCSPCHLGNPLESEEEGAHAGMVLVPGNLSNVNQTCGAANCHPAIAHRVEQSLMTTMAGVIAVDRFVFGESDSLSALFRVQDLGKKSPADLHLRQLCASCHLGNEKSIPAPPGEQSRGGGCIACHLDYSGAAELPAGSSRKFHPAVNLNVTNEHCFGCHSRSGRIATNYEGWHETTLMAGETRGKKGYRLLADGRVLRSMPPDVHHAAGLDCIDCHSARELMGDGEQYLHKEDAVRVRCQDCHADKSPPTAGFDQLDIESQKILLLRKADYLDAAFVLSPVTGEPLSNVFLDKNGDAILAGKRSGKRYVLTPPAAACSRGKAHAALSCSACHTGWAPQCIGCHNTYEPETPAYDQLSRQKKQGKWVEHLGVFFAEPPTLGVVMTDQGREIKPFVPGMVLTIDKTGFPGQPYSDPAFQRLFAPAEPHTTTRSGRSCTSCHNNPLALGYGRGELNFSESRWSFAATYAAQPQDGIPQDAWTGFLRFPPGISATRPNARPFTVEEQKRILRVGACLICHPGASEVMQKGLLDFDGILKQRRKPCRLPVWN